MQEEKPQIYERPWDAACPSGVTEIQHYRSLALVMVGIYFSTGAKGVFLVHPMIASIFAIIDPLRFGEFRWKGELNKAQLAGLIGGIELWVEASVGREILVTDGPDDLQPRARIVLDNFDYGPPTQPLDRMAHIA